mgnify:CR=1 FL=1
MLVFHGAVCGSLRDIAVPSIYFVQVYDVTAFLNDHPGGKKIIVSNSGKDVTETFYTFHKANIITKYGPQYLVGDLAKEE